ncbi:MAG: Gfo/Idh/MocA family protein [Calditrichia bacterium]
MNKPLKLAVLGVGRMGFIHARHVQELAEKTNTCQLVAVADTDRDFSAKTAHKLQQHQNTKIYSYASATELAISNSIDAAVIASPTVNHYQDTKILVDAGYRVLLEKPLTASLQDAKELTGYLDSSQKASTSVMLAFMRRFDEPLMLAKKLLDSGKIGRPFKYSSILEDPLPPPEGYISPGLLLDMAIHNIDEILWLHGDKPERAIAFGSNLYSHGESDVEEDFDDAMLQLWFPGNVLGQIQVSRNHVAGYRAETWIYGEQGMIHVGHFQDDPHAISVNSYSRDNQVIEKKIFMQRKYEEDVPVFATRFGNSYKSELTHFVDQCHTNSPFSVTHIDGFLAQQVAFASQRTVKGADGANLIRY